MKDLNKLKRFSSNDTLSLEEIMWINYAEDLGLPIDYIDNVFTYEKDYYQYKISGLFWKYTTINIIDNKFNNELYIGLERIYSKEFYEIKTEDTTIDNTQQSTTQTICVTPMSSNTSLFTTQLTTNSVIQTMSSISFTDKMADLENKIDTIGSNTENPIIKYAPGDQLYLSIPDFTKKFKLNGQNLPEIYPGIKFEVKLKK